MTSLSGAIFFPDVKGGGDATTTTTTSPNEFNVFGSESVSKFLHGIESAVKHQFQFFSKTTAKFEMVPDIIYSPVESGTPRIALTSTPSTQQNQQNQQKQADPRESMVDKSEFKPLEWEEATIVMEFMLHKLGAATDCSAYIEWLFSNASHKFKMEPCCFEQQSTILVTDEDANARELERIRTTMKREPNARLRKSTLKGTRRVETIVRRGEGYRLHIGFSSGRIRQFYTISIWQNLFSERPTFPESRKGNFDVPHPDEGFVPHPTHFKRWYQTIISYCIVWSPTIGKMLERNVESAAFHHHLKRIMDESDEAIRKQRRKDDDDDVRKKEEKVEKVEKVVKPPNEWHPSSRRRQQRRQRYHEEEEEEEVEEEESSHLDPETMTEEEEEETDSSLPSFIDSENSENSEQSD